LGIVVWELEIGPNPQSPIPNPQSPIPNPHFILLFEVLFYIKIIENINFLIICFLYIYRI